MTPDMIAELRRRHAALTPFAVRFLGRGPDGEPYITLACEDGSSPLPEPAFDAVLLFAELAAAELPALLDAADELLVCKTVARGWLERAERRAAERDALAAKVAALADWHETKADKARRFRIEIDGRNPVMDKAVEVHTDAARRLRAALDEEAQP